MEKENLITPWHLLTMTSDIDESKQLITKSNLTYLADAGTRWSYHNVFQKLIDIVGATSNLSFETFFNNKLKSKIGINGSWNNGLVYKIYHNNTHSMASYGLLALNKGKCNDE